MDRPFSSQRLTLKRSSRHETQRWVCSQGASAKNIQQKGQTLPFSPFPLPSLNDPTGLHFFLSLPKCRQGGLEVLDLDAHLPLPSLVYHPVNISFCHSTSLSPPFQAQLPSLPPSLMRESRTDAGGDNTFLQKFWISVSVTLHWEGIYYSKASCPLCGLNARPHEDAYVCVWQERSREYMPHSLIQQHQECRKRNFLAQRETVLNITDRYRDTEGLIWTRLQELYDFKYSRTCIML